MTSGIHMAASSTHSDVRRWLESILGKNCIPDFQLTKGGLNNLERLRKKCDEASHIDSKLRGLKEKNIIELEAEVKRTVSLIERSGKHLHEL